MITFTGFDMESFGSVLRIFAPEFDYYTPFTDKNRCIVTKKSKAGRPRIGRFVHVMDLGSILIGQELEVQLATMFK